MIKKIVLVKRHPSLTREEFSKHWREVHASIAMGSPAFSRCILKYVQNHVVPPEKLNELSTRAPTSVAGLAQPQAATDFDGIVEVYYAQPEDMQKSQSTADYEERIRPDESRFIHRENCVVFLTSEFVVFDEQHRPPAESELAG